MVFFVFGGIVRFGRGLNGEGYRFRCLIVWGRILVSGF